MVRIEEISAMIQQLAQQLYNAILAQMCSHSCCPLASPNSLTGWLPDGYELLDSLRKYLESQTQMDRAMNFHVQQESSHEHEKLNP